MKPYLIAAALGLLVGVIYALFNVRSPAPPVIALVGLLGILVGEQVPPLVKHVFQGSGTHSWLRHHVAPHVFGSLPGRTEPASTQSAQTDGSSVRKLEGVPRDV